MKKMLIMAGLVLTACTAVPKTHREQVYLLNSGLYAYEDHGVWWYMMESAGRYPQWRRGQFPSDVDLAGAVTHQEDIVNPEQDEGGEPAARIVTPPSASPGTAEEEATVVASPPVEGEETTTSSAPSEEE